MNEKKKQNLYTGNDNIIKCNAKQILQSYSVFKTYVGPAGSSRVSESVLVPGNSKQNPGSAEAGVGDDPGVRGTVGGRGQHFVTHVRKQAVPGARREKHVN